MRQRPRAVNATDIQRRCERIQRLTVAVLIGWVLGVVAVKLLL